MNKNVINTDLTGKVAVVTGAGGVLCSAFAKVLANAGAKVALLDINEAAAAAFAEEIVAEGGVAKAYKCNVLDKANCCEVAEQVKADFGPCDVLINGAGGNNPRATTDKEYYEAGDYDGLLRFYHTSMEENENADFYNWEHYSFLMCYENLCIFRESADKLDSDDFSDFDMHELFYCYISNRYYQKGYPMDEADQLLASGFEDEMESVIDSIHLTEDEQKTFNDFLNANEYPSWEEIEDFSKKIYKRLY